MAALLGSAVVLATAAMRTPARAADTVPAPLFLKIVLATVAFDRALDAKAGDTVELTIIGDSAYAGTLRKTLQGAADKKLKGKNLVLKETTLSALASSGVHIAIFADSLGGEVAKASSTCAGKSITCVAVDTADVEKGIALGVEQGADGKPKIVVNLAAAQKAGSDYSSQILRLARVIGQ